ELPSQFELRRLAAPYFHSRLDGGEGDMLVGKALWAHHKKKAHMICELSPYSCMPNTMSIGAMSGVIGKYPDLLYAPLELKGAAGRRGGEAPRRVCEAPLRVCEAPLRVL